MLADQNAADEKKAADKKLADEQKAEKKAAKKAADKKLADEQKAAKKAAAPKKASGNKKRKAQDPEAAPIEAEEDEALKRIDQGHVDPKNPSEPSEKPSEKPPVNPSELSSQSQQDLQKVPDLSLESPKYASIEELRKEQDKDRR